MAEFSDDEFDDKNHFYTIVFQDPNNRNNPPKEEKYLDDDMGVMLFDKRKKRIEGKKYVKDFPSPYGPVAILIDNYVDYSSRTNFSTLTLEAVYLEYDSSIVGQPTYQIVPDAMFPTANLGMGNSKIIIFQDPNNRYNPDKAETYSLDVIENLWLGRDSVIKNGDTYVKNFPSPYGPVAFLLTDSIFTSSVSDAMYLEHDSIIVGQYTYRLVPRPEFPIAAKPETFTASQTVTCGSIIQRLLHLEQCDNKLDLFSSNDPVNLYGRLINIPDITGGLDPGYAHVFYNAEKEKIDIAILKHEIVINLITVIFSLGAHANFIAYKRATREVYIYEPHGSPRIDKISSFLYIPDKWRVVIESCPFGLQRKFDGKATGLCSIWVCLIAFLWIRCPGQSIREVEEEVASYKRSMIGILMNNFYCYMFKGRMKDIELIGAIKDRDIDEIKMLIDAGAKIRNDIIIRHVYNIRDPDLLYMLLPAIERE